MIGINKPFLEDVASASEYKFPLTAIAFRDLIPTILDNKEKAKKFDELYRCTAGFTSLSCADVLGLSNLKTELEKELEKAKEYKSGNRYHGYTQGDANADLVIETLQKILDVLK